MHLNFKQLGLLMLAATALSACTQENIEIPKSEEYAREFIKQFGIVDPNHDWTAAQHVSVTVKTTTPTDIRILADFDGKTYRFGDFKKVNGTQTLSFDLPLGATDLALRANGNYIKTTPGSTVDFGSRSRADEQVSGMLTYHQADTFRIIPADIVRSYTEKVPENQFNINTADVHSNFSFIADGPFSFYPVYWQTSSDHKLGVYYYDTEGKYYEQEIYATKNGNDVQYYDDPELEKYLLTYEEAYTQPAVDEKIENEQTTYTYITPKELGWDKYNQYYNPWSEYESVPSEEEITTAFNQYWDKIKYTKYDTSWTQKVYTSYTYKHEGDKYSWELFIGDYTPAQPAKEIPAHWVDNNDQTKWTGCHGSPSLADNTKTPVIRSKAITINLPKGTHFGFYIDVYQNGYKHRCYSSANLNKETDNSIFNIIRDGEETHTHPHAKPEGWNYTNVPSDCYVTASYFNTNTPVTNIYGKEETSNRTFFGFEDWGFSDEIDLNDVIFMVDVNTVPDDEDFVDEDEPEPVFPWVIACEDLGGTYDHDFNDVVFGVQHEAGSKYAYVTALAAGGTLPVRLYYNGTEIKGGTDETDETIGAQYTVYSPTDTKIFDEWHQWFGKSSTEVTNAGDFKVGATIRIVVDEDFTMSGDPDNPNIEIGDNRLGGFHVEVDQTDGTTTTITAPVKSSNPGDNIPQMFVTTHKFEWPKERIPIYQTHRGDETGELIGTETPSNSTGTTKKYNYYTNSFHAWVNDATTHSGFHSQKATEPGNVVSHGWSGYDIPKETKPEEPGTTE